MKGHRKRKTQSWFRDLICLGLIFSLIFFAYLPSVLSSAPRRSAPSPKTTELRGVWLTNVSSGVLFTPWGVNRAIERLAQLNFNTLYPVVWNRGYTFYPSAIAKQMTGKLEEPFLSLMRGGSDVLAEIITEGHKQRLSILPWFEYGLIVPATSPLVKNHPDWLSQNLIGKHSLTENKTDEAFLKSNKAAKSKLNTVTKWLQSNQQQRLKQQVWLNPLHPAVGKFIQGLILEVVSNYDVDGIQLDDHFGLPVEFGYDSFTVKLYQREHQGKKPPTNPQDAEWMRWRAAKLTALMTKIVQAVKTVKPQVRISLSPNSQEFSYQNYLQDWKRWVQDGLVDELVLQVYRQDVKGFQAELGQGAVQFARSKIPVSVGILSGTWNRPVNIEQIQQQVKVVRDRGFNGVSFFYWETLWGYLTPDSPRQRRRIFHTLFAKPANRPKVAQGLLKDAIN